MAARQALGTATRAFSYASTSAPKAALEATASTSSAPLRRTKDPLLSSPTAQHYITPQGHSFIIRPPPSVLPPTIRSSPLAHALSSAESSLPALRQNAPPAQSLAQAQIEELQALRRSNPQYWTRGKLAQKFGVTQKVVGTLGWGEGVEGRLAERARREEVESERERKEGSWGWKKAIAREERRGRRSLW